MSQEEQPLVKLRFGVVVWVATVVLGYLLASAFMAVTRMIVCVLNRARSDELAGLILRSYTWPLSISLADMCLVGGSTLLFSVLLRFVFPRTTPT